MQVKQLKTLARGKETGGLEMFVLVGGKAVPIASAKLEQEFSDSGSKSRLVLIAEEKGPPPKGGVEG